MGTGIVSARAKREYVQGPPLNPSASAILSRFSRAETSAAAIRHVAVGRNEQRHVVVSRRLRDRESHGDLVEERRIAESRAGRTEVGADVEIGRASCRERV